MKNKLTILILLLLLIITSGCSRNNTDEPYTEEPTIECPECNTGICTEGKYEFPVLSDVSNWMQCPNFVSARKKCLQIPDACLGSLSTKGLLETCLEYPYFIDVFAYNDYQTGFNSLVRQFNGYRELLERPDLINALLEKYAAIGDERESYTGKVLFSFRHFVFEFILAQDAVVDNLSEEQKKILVLLSFENIEMKKDNPDEFSGINFIPTYLLYAKLVINDPDFKFESIEQKNTVLGIIQTPRGYDQQIFDYIENYFYEKYK